MAMILQLTNAGRAALINDEGSGTAATKIESIGITATAFTFDPAMTTLPDEAKRITTIGGTVHDGTLISMAMKDESADSYTMRAFGLYLEDGTLLAAYSQADPVVEKHPEAHVLLQLDLTVLDADVDISRLSFGDVEFVNPHATETVVGVARLATRPEAEGMADNTTIMTPLKTAHAIAKYTATESKPGIARIATADEAAAGALADVFITPATLLSQRQALGWRLGEVVADGSGVMWINSLPWNTTHPSEANAQGWLRALRLVMVRKMFPASGTYYKPAGLVYALVEVLGGGGGGGQVQAVAGNACVGGGGGAGAYANSLLAAANIADTVYVTVGAAGPSGSGGGASSFGNLVVATGGGGGAGGAIGTSGGASGGLGGVISAGQLGGNGSRGGVGWWPNASVGVSGYGAASHYGAGGHPRILGLNIYQNGDHAYGVGAGGSGAAVSGAHTTYAVGGNGGPGLVIVTEYIVLS